MPGKQAILFLIDTQGANCVGCYQPGLGLQTPHIDRLAADSSKQSVLSAAMSYREIFPEIYGA